MSGVVSRVTILITHIRGLITPLRTTHEPPFWHGRASREGTRAQGASSEPGVGEACRT